MKQNYAEYHFQNRDSEISDTEHSALWSNGLSVLSKLVADAADSSCYCPVYETEKERIDQRTKKETELSVQGCAECIKRSCTGWLLCRKCSGSMFQGPGETVSERDRYREGVSLHRNTAQSQCSG